MLLRYQRDNLNKLIEVMEKHEVISVIGKPNTGRTEVVSALENNGTVIIKVISNPQSLQSYEGILNAIKHINKLKKRNYEINLNIALAHNSLGISMGTTVNDLYKLENELVKRIIKLSFRKKIIIVIKNPMKTDYGTKEIIDRVLNYRKFWFLRKKIMKIEICDSVEQASGYPVYFDRLSQEPKDCDSILKELNLNPEIHLSNSIIKFIFRNADGNISLISRIIKDINNKDIDSKFSVSDKNLTINELINYSISSKDYAEKLKNILVILSICNRYFTSLDLSFLMKEEINLVELYLKCGVDYNILYYENNEYTLMFEIIRKIFSAIPDNKRIEIYNNIVKLISEYYPDRYYEKYKFATLANMPNAVIYLMQDIMKQIRITGKYNKKEFINLLSDKELKIIEVSKQFLWTNCQNIGNGII